ncbi:MAG: amidohydrolase family protein [Clostridiaceae bacterium]|nr:amidohydrolase family protein [Clostridiaceae bacterium]
MIVDFHVHCFPDEVAVKAVPKLASVAGIPARLNGTINGIKDSMIKSGVDHCVVLTIATKPSQTETINTWASEIQDSGITAFGSIHPQFEGWKNELKRIKDIGLKGIKLHPDYQNFFVDDENLFPIYEMAFKLGLIVLFHTGVDIGLPPPCHATPERLIRVVKAYPGARIVAAHMGGFSLWDEVESILAGEDIFLDTSYSLGSISTEQLKRIIGKHGYEKILFATDSPWKDQSEEIIKIRELMLGSEVEKAILGLNAKKLLRI